MTRDECKANFIKPDKVDEVLAKQPQLEYSGFCPVYFVRSNGVLWKGDPDRGLVQTADMKLYAFVNEDSQSRYWYSMLKYLSESGLGPHELKTQFKAFGNSHSRYCSYLLCCPGLALYLQLSYRGGCE